MSYQTAAAHLTAANTSRDGSGANLVKVFEAYEPCYVDRVIFQSLGSNAATVARVFLSSLKTEEGRTLNREVTLPSTSATEVAGLAAVSLSLGLYLATGQRLYCTVGTAQSAGTDVCAVVGRSHSDFNV